MAFKTIETQEEFEEAIKDRLERQKSTLLKEYEGKEHEGYNALKEENEELKQKIIGLENQIENSEENKNKIEELSKKIKEYELNALKTKYAIENNIPVKFANRISGATEDEIKADAESLSEVFKTELPEPPLKNSEEKEDGDDLSLKNMLKELEGE